MPTVATFERALSDRPVTVTRTTSVEFDEILGERLDRPAVGVPLQIEGVSLTDHPVEIEPTPNQLTDARTGVTPVGPAVAEYGSVVVQSGDEGAEQVSLYPDTHVGVLPESDIVDSLAAALAELSDSVADEGLTSAVFATGPSGTADMGAVVWGAHGPESVHLIVLEDR
jgi:L-lactate dehydrogenase complex protein LldG